VTPLRSLAVLLALVAPLVAAADELPVRSEGAKLFAKSFGAGDVVLVAIPGGPGLSHDYLAPLAKLAGPERRVVLYDPRGTGASELPPSGLDLDAQVADLDAVRRAAGVERIHVLGHSWGTLVAIAYADEHPTHVASVILVGMGAPTEASDRASFGRRFAGRKAQLLRTGVIAKKKAPTLRGDDCMPIFDAILPVHFADPTHAEAWTLPGTYRCSTGRLVKKAVGAWNMKRALGRLLVPVLVLSGDTDMNDEGLEETVRLLPRARLTNERLGACGHFPFLECPEPFFTRVDQFLLQVP
jgi:pimeloyl-ACP methyl ester carboxylesterase